MVCYRLAHIRTMKNPYIIPAVIIGAAILAGFWMLKPSSEPQSEPHKVTVVPPSEPHKVIVIQPPDIPLWQAIRDINIEAVKQHIAAGTDVNAKGSMGYAPLHYAAGSANRKNIAELLIAAGADVNATTRDGETPLDLAIRYDKVTAHLISKHGGVTAQQLARGELKAEGK